jgi:hypothetical protein
VKTAIAFDLIVFDLMAFFLSLCFARTTVFSTAYPLPQLRARTTAPSSRQLPSRHLTAASHRVLNNHSRKKSRRTFPRNKKIYASMPD